MTEWAKRYRDAETPIQKQTASRALAYNDDTLELTHVITSEHEDRYGEVVEAGGMVVSGHVPVLYGHGYSSVRDDVPVARMVEAHPETIDGVGVIIARTQFYRPSAELFRDERLAADAAYFPLMLYDLHKQGLLRGWSIGFRALDTNVVETPAPVEGGESRSVRHFTRWELLEYSTVPIPANPYAVDKMVAAVEDAGARSTMARLFPSLAQPGISSESWLARLARSAEFAKRENER